MPKKIKSQIREVAAPRQSRSWKAPALITLAILTAGTARAETSASGAKHDDPTPFVHVHDKDKAMDEAVHEAQRTLAKFMAALAAPKASQTGFAVKKRCIEADKCEHIWLTAVTFDGKVLSGTVDNDPVEVKSLRFGQKVTLRPEEISDWMYVENGKLVGGYTVLAHYRKLPEAGKREMAKNLGFRLE